MLSGQNMILEGYTSDFLMLHICCYNIYTSVQGLQYLVIWFWFLAVFHYTCSSNWLVSGTQWCTFSLVSSHRLIKIPKDQLFQPPLGPWSNWNTCTFSWSHVPSFLWCWGQACYCFPDKFKPQVSAKDSKGVDKCIWNVGTPCFGWSKPQCMVNSQSAWCFVGFI